MTLRPLILSFLLFARASPPSPVPSMSRSPSWTHANSGTERGPRPGAGPPRGPPARARFKDLWKTITVDDLPSPKEYHWQWMFPCPATTRLLRESYDADDYRFLDGPAARGYPGLRLYIRDIGRLGLRTRTGKSSSRW